MNNFRRKIDFITEEMRHQSKQVHTAKWQGVDIAKKPEMEMHELTHVHFNVPMGSEDLDQYRSDIEPNLPWADKHFEERVCGQPINPGIEWKNWPWGHSAEKFLDDSGKFNHNYMERYWPKHAGLVQDPTLTAKDWEKKQCDYPIDLKTWPNRGIYNEYGDLQDVVKLLAKDPLTRQAYLPVFFPEDTGACHGGRIPCSIGYHFLMREGKLDVSYVIRSCDFVRHFRDDIYLTVRLALWVLEETRKLDKGWRRVTPGNFVMLISSLHCFRNDFDRLFRGE